MGCSSCRLRARRQQHQCIPSHLGAGVLLWAQLAAIQSSAITRIGVGGTLHKAVAQRARSKCPPAGSRIAPTFSPNQGMWERTTLDIPKRNLRIRYVVLNYSKQL